MQTKNQPPASNVPPWHTIDAANQSKDMVFECDVVVIGSGAGAAKSASILARSGLKTLIIEEGSLKSQSDFKMREDQAYPQLYQESASRLTKDSGINIFQGRTVGGSTVINWTTSFRTPQTTLRHWKNVYGVDGLFSPAMTGGFEEIENEYGIREWEVPPNSNNHKLQAGLQKLGISSGIIHRNIGACRNLGYCGLGCPVGAKNDALKISITDALNHKALLIYHCRAERLVARGQTLSELICYSKNSARPKDRIKLTIKAKQFVLGAGAVGSPALLLRSKVENPDNLIGKRTFLHPTCGVSAVHTEDIHPYYGAPQSVYSDAFLDDSPAESPIGFKLETAPLQPVLSSQVIQGYGRRHAVQMQQLKNTSNIIALLRDGFHEESPGGEVYLKSDGTPGVDYKFNPYMWDGVKRAYMKMSEIMFASGANWVTPIHASSNGFANYKEAKNSIPNLPYEMLEARLFSAHVMGGLSFGEDPTTTVCDSYGRFRPLDNLTVVDASIFPTSLGANPQVSVYTFSARNTRKLLERL